MSKAKTITTIDLTLDSGSWRLEHQHDWHGKDHGAAIRLDSNDDPDFPCITMSLNEVDAMIEGLNELKAVIQGKQAEPKQLRVEDLRREDIGKVFLIVKGADNGDREREGVVGELERLTPAYHPQAVAKLKGHELHLHKDTILERVQP